MLSYPVVVVGATQLLAAATSNRIRRRRRQCGMVLIPNIFAGIKILILII
jgi:predicted membrane protein